MQFAGVQSIVFIPLAIHRLLGHPVLATDLRDAEPAFHFLQNADDLFFLVACSSACHETILLLSFYSDNLTLPGTLFGGIDQLFAVAEATLENTIQMIRMELREQSQILQRR